MMRLESLVSGVLATRVEFPFGDSVFAAQAMIVERQGISQNVLVYASSHIGDYVDHIRELGRLYHQLQNHRDEASEACNILDAPVFCHALEQEAIAKKGARVDQTFDGDEYAIGDDITAYHAPGHTRGVAMYHWRRGDDESSVLFSGDSLYSTTSGELDYALRIHPYAGNKDDYKRTLALVRRLKPTFIIPGLSASGTFVFPYDDEAIARLEEKLAKEV